MTLLLHEHDASGRDNQHRAHALLLLL
jgi:hypothetical protein